MSTATAAKCRCQHCSQEIEFEYANAGQTVACPYCGMETKLFIPETSRPKTVRPMAPVKPVKAHLAYIRANTCYGVLRGLIEVVFGLALIAAIGEMALLIMVSRGAEFISAAWLICGTLAAIVVLFALRQCAFLLIDIADTLLHEHSKME